MNKKMLSGIGSRERSSASPDAHLGRSADVLLAFREAVWDFGRQRAIEAGVLDVDPEAADDLAAQAGAWARAQLPAPFDPDQHLSDRLMWEEHGARQRRVGHLRTASAWCRKRLREREDERASLLHPGEAPRFPLFSLLAVVTLFAASLTPSFQSLISAASSTPNPVVIQWGIPFFFALVVGVGLSFPQLKASSVPGASLWQAHGCLLAGALSALGIGVFRFSLGSSASSVGLAWALLGLDVAAVIIAEVAASVHRKRWANWHLKEEAYRLKSQRVEVARAELDDTERQLQEELSQQAGFEREVHERLSLWLAGDSLEAHAREDLLGGYRSGVAENLAKVGRARDDV